MGLPGAQATVLNIESKMISVPARVRKATCKAFQVKLFHHLVFRKITATPVHTEVVRVRIRNTFWLLESSDKAIVTIGLALLLLLSNLRGLQTDNHPC